jgi:hypothetical protein
MELDGIPHDRQHKLLPDRSSSSRVILSLTNRLRHFFTAKRVRALSARTLAPIGRWYLLRAAS